MQKFLVALLFIFPLISAFSFTPFGPSSPFSSGFMQAQQFGQLTLVSNFSNQTIVTNSFDQVLNTTSAVTFANVNISGLTSGRVPFVTTSGQLTDNNNLTWDATNKRLGINTAAPVRKLEVAAAGATQFRTSNGAAYTDFYTSATGTLGLLPSGGLTGINKVTPQYALDIDALTGYGQVMNIVGNSGNSAASLTMAFTNGNLGGTAYGVTSTGDAYFASNTAGKNLGFYSINTALATITSSGSTIIGAGTPYSKLDVVGTNSIHISGTNVDSGGYFDSAGNNAFYLSGGAKYSSYGSDYVFLAKTTGANGQIMENGNAYFYGNSGLTAGNTFTPTRIMTIVGASSAANTLYLKTGYVGINTTNPTNPLDVQAMIGASNISIYAKGNVSATGFITRTSVYDKTKGKALDKIKDANDYKQPDGTLNHSAFYGFVDGIITNDYTRPTTTFTPTQKCETILTLNATDGTTYGVPSCKTYQIPTTTYATKTEQGVDLGKEIDFLRQALFEIKQCTALSKSWNEYQICVNS